MPQGGQPLPEPVAPAGMAERVTVETDAEDQAHLYIGHLTVPRNHPDYTALEMVAVTLGSGAGLTGRIPMRIREQEGLAYSAHAQTVAGAGEDAGRLVAYVGTSPATVAKAEAGIVEEIERLVQDGIEPAELEEARAYLLDVGLDAAHERVASSGNHQNSHSRSLRIDIDGMSSGFRADLDSASLYGTPYPTTETRDRTRSRRIVLRTRQPSGIARRLLSPLMRVASKLGTSTILSWFFRARRLIRVSISNPSPHCGSGSLVSGNLITSRQCRQKALYP
jgi:hypothetical protein